MDVIESHLAAISPRLNSLARGDRDFFDELQQRVALAILVRVRGAARISIPVALGIAWNIRCDMVSERRKHRQRFVSSTDLDKAAGASDECALDVMSSHALENCEVFDLVWARNCCEPLRGKIRELRKSLRPQELRCLRGLRRGLTQAQVGLREGVPAGTVACWVSRIRRRLEAVLAQ